MSRGLLAILASALYLHISGCATITSGTMQQMSVDTGDVVGATCVGVDKVGRSVEWQNTPSSAQVRKGDGPMTITCSKVDHPSASITVNESLTTNTFGNVLLGGLIGAGIDAASGAAQKYPDSVTVPMKINAPLSTSNSERELATVYPIDVQLQRLNAEKEAGSLSEQEFQTQRRKLLDKL